MTRRALVAHRRRNGCMRLREGGNHTIYLNPANHKSAPVPRHREIATGLAVRICRELEVPDP